MDKRTAGFLGGLQNYYRHGSAHMREIGRLGGRPRKKDNQAPDANSDNRERRYQSETTETGMTPMEFREHWRIKA